MYIGTITSYRENIGRAKPKILLTNVLNEDGTLFRDHCWVSHSKRFKKFNFGDTIEFTAVLKPYVSCEGEKVGLSHLRHLKLSSTVKVK